MSAQPASPDPRPASGLTEVRYSLPELLRDVKLERETSALAMEKLEQSEIALLFRKNRPRRAPRTGK